MLFEILQQCHQGYKKTDPGTDNYLPVKITMRSPGACFGNKQINKYRDNKGKRREPKQLTFPYCVEIKRSIKKWKKQ